MTDPTLVDILGTIVGCIWISAAVYFQLIRERPVHPGYVASLLLIGVALMLSSAALPLAGRTSTIQLLGVFANALFIALGLGVWYALEISADLEDAKTCDADTDLTQP
ncbi:transmembrane domain protein [Halobacterium phage ChaoS9]|uniref:Transmembrane domain protein n=1 Tax=Halobacterium phage ChaoS9 TaxID=2847105 RepID=A0A481VAW5_9CAUD|nr:holin [Halobacterium phage ChaoS9]QBI90086.1 transmembrane domain protein [Halobacterium phage ChaoS9]